MNIVFRADASINIGSGHIMRCLTLADALTERGHQCRFICRPHKGHLGDFIHQKGYHVEFLSAPRASDQVDPITDSSGSDLPPHAHWLGATWQQDAEQTLQTLSILFTSGQAVDWLIVDHYALDYHWQDACEAGFKQLMVIDDLADRKHRCNLLLDQTFGRTADNYQSLVPAGCQILTGAQYALLRPEFSEWRTTSLKRRQSPELNNLLINLGGVDKDNITGTLLKAIDHSHLPESCELTVVMGVTAPHIEQVKQIAAELKQPCQVLQGVNNMAELMANADFAIGAAGSTSWERCCLGLPTLMIILAENQQTIAKQLQAAGAAQSLSIGPKLAQQVAQCFDQLSPNYLSNSSQAAQAISDGLGCLKVVNYLEQESQ
ncbi:UDP-2,4-diacetamido-2,4,6-trideoxy-beta-L-altropyranose hydrolase [Oceanospirillum beijerinckii]|uniref:UDP-2,4-diacetamido-2,4, 6-trideoxy-beta-L-altropyranose hydrolase n=1 Tax=Oceanospirillum beijerinckii TaxID=64976 RepID=UPI000403643B|nr:UDP-2,4-diacetamido-2,4,6-trideoxy-beta-L-altropyranose hydrolase [Oceanospirillum beijerinckii]